MEKFFLKDLIPANNTKSKEVEFSEGSNMKFIVVCGSGLSGIGKGIAISSIGSLL